MCCNRNNHTSKPRRTAEPYAVTQKKIKELIYYYMNVKGNEKKWTAPMLQLNFFILKLI